MTLRERATIIGRVFSIATILGVSASIGSSFATQNVILLGAIAFSATVLTTITRLPPEVVAAGEGLLVGLVLALTMPYDTLLVPYLAVPVMVASLYRGLIGVCLVIGTEVVGMGLIALVPGSRISAQDTSLFLLWLSTALGVGLLGTLIRSLSASPPADANYEDARELLVQLHSVSRHLSAGLDPVTIAGRMLDLADTELGGTRAAVFTRSDNGRLSPLRYSEGAGPDKFWDVADHDDRAWSSPSTARAEDRGPEGFRVLLPIRVGAVAIGCLVVDSDQPPAQAALTRLSDKLEVEALRLDTALLFEQVRSIATAEERRRLAREVHDGIAQEVASLGYLVDDLAATATDTSRAGRLRDLRAELSKMTNDLRLSIFDLRSDVTATLSLGATLSDYVRQIGVRSTMRVHLTLDEAPTRLRVETESELLRIAQEAITNARKHAEAQNLWVSCTVAPPFAELEVRDDGKGLDSAGDNSYGLKIMRERATRIGADLEVRRIDGGGTLVRVTVGAEQAPRHAQPSRKGGHA